MWDVRVWNYWHPVITVWFPENRSHGALLEDATVPDFSFWSSCLRFKSFWTSRCLLFLHGYVMLRYVMDGMFHVSKKTVSGSWEQFYKLGFSNYYYYYHYYWTPNSFASHFVWKANTVWVIDFFFSCVCVGGENLDHALEFSWRVPIILQLTVSRQPCSSLLNF